MINWTTRQIKLMIMEAFTTINRVKGTKYHFIDLQEYKDKQNDWYIIGYKDLSVMETHDELIPKNAFRLDTIPLDETIGVRPDMEDKDKIILRLAYWVYAGMGLEAGDLV